MTTQIAIVVGVGLVAAAALAYVVMTKQSAAAAVQPPEVAAPIYVSAAEAGAPTQAPRPPGLSTRVGNLANQVLNAAPKVVGAVQSVLKLFGK